MQPPAAHSACGCASRDITVDVTGKPIKMKCLICSKPVLSFKEYIYNMFWKWGIIICPHCGTEYLPSFFNIYIIIFSIVTGLIIVFCSVKSGLNTFHVFLVMTIFGSLGFTILIFFFPKLYYVPIRVEQEKSIKQEEEGERSVLLSSRSKQGREKHSLLWMSLLILLSFIPWYYGKISIVPFCFGIICFIYLLKK